MFSKLRRTVSVSISRNIWSSAYENGDIVLRDAGRKLVFPAVWLRDNCQCQACFNQDGYSRLIDIEYINCDVAPTIMRIFEEDAGKFFLSVNWSDHHDSRYDSTWLRERSFDQRTSHDYLKNVYQYEKIPWKAADFPRILKKFPFENLMKNDRDLLNFLTALSEYGVVGTENVPPDPESNAKLINRIGYLKKTFYGETFTVESKVGTKNVAYLSTPLQLHGDLPYYEYAPCINSLHCLKQAEDEGGRNQFSDALDVCSHLKNFRPASYKILRETPVNWSDIGEDSGYVFHTLYRAPVICENFGGEIYRINFNQPQRDSHFNVTAEEAKNWYAALKEFVDRLKSPENLVEFKMKPGEMVTFDNLRVLHGRTGYSSQGRCLVGAYLDWDVVRSRIRILKKSLE